MSQDIGKIAGKEHLKLLAIKGKIATIETVSSWQHGGFYTPRFWLPDDGSPIVSQIATAGKIIKVHIIPDDMRMARLKIAMAKMHLSGALRSTIIELLYQNWIEESTYSRYPQAPLLQIMELLPDEVDLHLYLRRYLYDVIDLSGDHPLVNTQSFISVLSVRKRMELRNEVLLSVRAPRLIVPQSDECDYIVFDVQKQPLQDEPLVQIDLREQERANLIALFHVTAQQFVRKEVSADVVKRVIAQVEEFYSRAYPERAWHDDVPAIWPIKKAV